MLFPCLDARALFSMPLNKFRCMLRFIFTFHMSFSCNASDNILSSNLYHSQKRVHTSQIIVSVFLSFKVFAASDSVFFQYNIC
jgi:hypothetical protein